MKAFAVFVGLLFVASVHGQCNYNPGISAVDLENLNFCTFLNGQQADYVFTGYTTLLDDALSIYFTQVSSYINQTALSNGFETCPSCLNAIKNALCLSVFARPGYFNCLISGILNYYATVCPEICNYDSTCCLICNDGGSACPTRIPEASAYNACASRILANPFNWVNFIDSCSSFLPDDEYCHTMVSVCSCGNNNGVNVCDFYGWSDEGAVISGVPDPGAACTWCTSKRETRELRELVSLTAKKATLKATRQAVENSFQINSHLTLGGVPGSNGPQDTSGFSFSLQPSDDVDDCLLNPNSCHYTELKLQNSPASIVVPSLFLLALAALVFF